MLILVIGLFFTYFEVTVPFYLAAILVLISYYGKSQSESNQIQRYLLITYALFLLNHAYIYKFVY
jgi:hypothetical protein